MYEKIKLKNNIRFILIPKKENKTINTLVMAGIGSRYERDNTRGVSHFIEHLMFKGTDKRPTTLDLSKELDSVGAEYNAYTGKEYTGYYVKANTKHFSKVCDVLFDMLNNSKFDASEIEREKKVIIEEINMYEDNPLMHIEDIYEEAVFFGNSLADNIAGTREGIRRMTRADIIDFKNKNYNSDNLVVGLAGDITDEVKATLTKYFEKYSLVDGEKDRYAAFSQVQQENRIILSRKETEQVQVALGFPGLKYDDKRMPALKLLAIILGGNMSSRLFISIRERKGLAYFIRAMADAYLDTGTLKIQAGIDKGRIFKAVRAIVDELKLLVDKGISDEELKRAQDYIEGKLYLSLEDLSDLDMWFVEQEILTNKILTPQERIKDLYNVNKEEVNALAKDIIANNKFNIAVIGPFEDKEKFLKILKI